MMIKSRFCEISVMLSSFKVWFSFAVEVLGVVAVELYLSKLRSYYSGQRCVISKTSEPKTRWR